MVPKFPFCFFEAQDDNFPGEVTLRGVRFRYQFHPKMDTNISYPEVLIICSTGAMVVCGLNGELVFTCQLECHFVPETPK